MATRPTKKVTTEYSYWLGVLGTLCSAVSLISLIQKTFNIGLSPAAREVITYYRKLFHFPFELISPVMPFAMPNWYRDLFIISFIILSVYLRTDMRFERVKLATAFERGFTSIFYPLLLSIPLLGLVQLVLMLSVFLFRPTLRPAKDDDDRVTDGLRRSRYYWLSLVSVVAAAIVFFAINSQA